VGCGLNTFHVAIATEFCVRHLVHLSLCEVASCARDISNIKVKAPLFSPCRPAYTTVKKKSHVHYWQTSLTISDIRNIHNIVRTTQIKQQTKLWTEGKRAHTSYQHVWNYTDEQVVGCERKENLRIYRTNNVKCGVYYIITKNIENISFILPSYYFLNRMLSLSLI